MSEKKITPVTLGPVTQEEADSLVEQYQAAGYQAIKIERPPKAGQNREGQYMVEVKSK